VTPTPELMLMLLADARLPVAGHTQSASLEPAVTDGLAAARVPDYIAARLDTVTRVEAATAVVALHRIREGRKLDEVEAAWAARTPSPAMRRTSRMQARALLRLVHQLWPEAAVLPAAEQPGAPRAVVLAGVADAAGLSPGSLARLVGYDDVQTVASAALKLLPLDPALTTRWVYDALPLVDALADDVADLTCPTEIPVAGAPQIEAWAQAHAVAPRRLFSA
jgi:urease accessory protein